MAWLVENIFYSVLGGNLETINQISSVLATYPKRYLCKIREIYLRV